MNNFIDKYLAGRWLWHPISLFIIGYTLGYLMTYEPKVSVQTMCINNSIYTKKSGEDFWRGSREQCIPISKE
jgi:hypothetical protein